jgi:hypothetical protein
VWLVFLNLTIMAFAWTCTFPLYFSDVLWSLGWAELGKNRVWHWGSFDCRLLLFEDFSRIRQRSSSLEWRGGRSVEDRAHAYSDGRLLLRYFEIPAFLAISVEDARTDAIGCAVARLDQPKHWLARTIAVFGQVPLFYLRHLVRCVLFLYPLCCGFMKIKQAHRDWARLRYL